MMAQVVHNLLQISSGLAGAFGYSIPYDATGFFAEWQSCFGELFFEICKIPFRRLAEAMLHAPCLVAMIQLALEY